VEETDAAPFASAMAAAGKLDAVSEQQIVEGGAGIGTDEFSEGEEFDLDGAFGFHGAC
jgi:hypothetical protein